MIIPTTAITIIITAKLNPKQLFSIYSSGSSKNFLILHIQTPHIIISSKYGIGSGINILITDKTNCIVAGRHTYTIKPIHTNIASIIFLSFILKRYAQLAYLLSTVYFVLLTTHECGPPFDFLGHFPGEGLPKVAPRVTFFPQYVHIYSFCIFLSPFLSLICYFRK